MLKRGFDKEEEAMKKTLTYQADALYTACKNLKEVVMNELCKHLSFICIFIKGIGTAIKMERKYNYTIKRLNVSNVCMPHNPEILSIQRTTPFTYEKAEEIYNISQEYHIPVDMVIEFVIKSGLDVTNIKRAIEAKEIWLIL